MWQVAVAAAVAGSGILAKHLFTQLQREEGESRTSQQQPPPQVDDFDNPISEEQQQSDKDGIFMFSSSGSRSISKKKRRNFGGVVRRGKTMVGHKKVGGKRASVCLKKRRTGSARICTQNHSSSSSSSKECSSFGWGLGLGILYMMSAGKAEVSKLSNAIDETTKLVHELKTKLSSQCPQLENVYDDTDTMDPKQKPKKKQENPEPCTLNKQPIKAKDTIHFVDSEYASSVLTEEQQFEGVEMGQLESELESELQKLPWCTIETSGHGGNINNSLEYERCETMKPSSTMCQSGGISPAELKNKLSHLLIEQQENHILELESELNLAYSKLQEKDGELRALKDCVRRLTEFSLTSVSDEETEACREERQRLKKEDCEATIGMKRAMDFETCGYEVV